MYKKILIYFIIILTLCISFFSIKTFSSAKEEYIKQEEKSLSHIARLIANDIESLEDAQVLMQNSNVTKFSHMTDLRLTIVKRDGEVVYDSENTGQTLENHATRPEIEMALQGETSVNIRYSETLDVDMMYVAVPIVKDDTIIGVVRDSVSLKAIDSMTVKLTKDLLFMAVLALAISILAFYILIKGIIRPLSETTEFAKEISQGNYQKRLSMIRDDEIGSLTQSLNHMAKQLEYSFRELSDRNSQLESVLSNIKNGIIAINEKNQIILINSSAYTMLHLTNKELLGKDILEAIRNHNFYKIITELDFEGEQEIHSLETKIDDHIYSIYTKPIIEHQVVKGFIIVIEDITQIRKLENIRRDFVANVTHELKTPITSIKGFIETLLGGDVKEENIRVKFYNIIDVEVNRLIRLVEDILTLSSLDSISTINDYEREIIDVSANLDNIFTLMKKIASNQGVQLSYEVEDNIKTISFNRNYFKQIMINLIDNAIKYNKKNGYVKVRIFKVGKSIFIEVMDSGIGIPPKDLPRIFERFYRVDKGRSRQAGGTGLGLAIVKHMIQIQNSSIKVDSQLGIGTKFTVIIPLDN